MYHAGDFPAGFTTLCIPFDSFAASTGAPSAVTNFAAGDVTIFKDGGTTQRTSANGITVSTSFDTNTGLQMIVIDLSDNTDSGFYAAGHEYQVAIADITIDSQTVRFWAATFSIERAGGILALLKATGSIKVDVNKWLSTTVSTPTVAGVPNVNTKTWNDLATVALPLAPATAGRTLVVDAAGLADANVVKLGPTGSGTAQTAKDVGAAVPAAAPGAAGGLFIAGTNAPVTITGAGNALTLTSTSGNGYGLLASGQGTGAGVGAVGGATNGHGIASVAQGSGSGVYTIASGATGNGFFAQGNTTGFGIGAIGGSDGHGIVGQGGVNATPTGTHGIYGQAGSNNGTGVRGQGCITNGDGNSIGIGGVGSVQGGAGIKGVALANDFAGIQGIGVAAGPGALFEGGATGAGAGFLGGGTSGSGVSFAAQAGNSDGITSTKSGSGYALNITTINPACDLTSTMKTSVNAEVVDGLNVDTYAEIGQENPAATQSMRKMLAYLYKAWRNRSSQTSTAYKLYADDATTVDQKSTVSDDGTTFESGEKATGP